MKTVAPPRSLIPERTRERTLSRLDRCWRDVFKPITPLKPSVWCEKNIVIKKSARPGPLRWDNAPYLREIVDCVTDDEVERITLQCAAQIGKTLGMWSILSYLGCEQPQDILLAMPDEQTAKQKVKTEFNPWLQDCLPLKRKLLDDRYADSILLKQFSDFNLRFCGNSPSQLASFPICYLILDEVGKFKDATDKEAPAVSLAIERTSTFKGKRKIIAASTPTFVGDYITQFFEEGTQEHYHVPCLDCHTFQPLVFEQLQFGHCKHNGEWLIPEVKESTWYKCANCGGQIHDYHKPEMLRKGRWVANFPERRIHRSFQLSKLYPIWVSFGDFAAEFLQSKSFIGRYQNFYNSWRGEAWTEISNTANEESILSHRGEYPQHTIPQPPLGIVMTVDVGKRDFHYVIRGWCQNETSFLIDAGFVQSFDDLLAVAQQVIKTPEGDMRISHRVIDSGYEASDIYRFCHQHDFIPVKGFRRQNQPLKWGKVDGETLNLLEIDTTFFKDAFQAKLKVSNGAPGSWNLFDSIGNGYAKHLTGEICVEAIDKATGQMKREWKKVGDNHFLDCEIYQLAMAYALQLRFVKEAPPTVEQKQIQLSKKLPPQSTFRRPDGRDFWDRGSGF